MDLVVEPQKGRPFIIEVTYFDTVLDIKQKIQKYQHIPISMQTLIFNNQILPDDADIEKSQLLHNSHLQLQIAADFFNKTETASFSPLPSTVKFSVTVKTPSSNKQTLTMDANDTVLELKQIVEEIEPVPLNQKLIAHLSGKELHNDQMLRDYCHMWGFSEVVFSLRPLSPPQTAASVNRSRKTMRVVVSSECGVKKVVEVNPSENVRELRKVVEKWNQRNEFPLPPNGYFFIYQQNVMDEDMSFRWNRVSYGGEIEVFEGRVTGGGS